MLNRAFIQRFQLGDLQVIRNRDRKRQEILWPKFYEATLECDSFSL